MTTSRYIVVADLKLHFHTMGSGPALAMFHPSPSSSESLLPLAKILADTYTVFVFDTPGYGKSEGLGFVPTTVKEYTAFFKKAFEAMKMDRFAIYGSATGAQIAIRYALENPTQVSHVFLDNSAHFDDALCEAILTHYFPDLTPQLDGNHLGTIWQIVSQMFQYFPWCFTTKEYALNRPQMPANILHMVAMDYLIAGADYAHAYRAAFKHERGMYVQQLQVPTTIFKWEGSIIAKYIDALIAFDYTNNVSSFLMEGDATERTHLMTQYMKDKATSFELFAAKTHFESYQPVDKIKYHKDVRTAPSVRDDGQHLTEAWTHLVEQNPLLNAEQIQSCLIDWYSN